MHYKNLKIVYCNPSKINYSIYYNYFIVIIIVIIKIISAKLYFVTLDRDSTQFRNLKKNTKGIWIRFIRLPQTASLRTQINTSSRKFVNKFNEVIFDIYALIERHSSSLI